MPFETDLLLKGTNYPVLSPRSCGRLSGTLEISIDYRQGRHEIGSQNDDGAPTSGTQPHINPSPDALETDMSRDIKLRDLTDEELTVAFDTDIDPSRITAKATQIFGSNAPTAVAYCGLDAWLEGDDKKVRFWGQVLNRLRT